MKSNLLTALSLSIALSAAGSATAHQDHSAHKAASPAASAPAVAASSARPAREMAEAEVRRVDRDAKKITLKHGAIKSLDMPAMTMVFQVKDAALLDKVQAGDKVNFEAEQQQGAYVVTAIEKVTSK
jgi:Cu(I)/Ag(I) efflux system periplasmic protein CusF